ncbi:hypothetical protein NA57DRAFT_76531 [Rhizodiscina lignyota]|uniref:Uncharacterized protein n=1 Tax=Rhizodiscina lignyota TaxID=1504668 RepID=A0A9P4M7W2_9PEZI|nr:hypothetical protein NA57DRAFT_76531 [Rhizodiscina lignyota]
MANHTFEHCSLDQLLIKIKKHNNGEKAILIFRDTTSGPLVGHFRHSSTPLSSKQFVLRSPSSTGTMFDAIKMSRFLTNNVDEDLFPRMFIMTPNGNLLAYSTPADTKSLRDRAALISVAWKERESGTRNRSSRPGSPASAASSAISTGSLETITIEVDTSTIMVRAIQPNLLFVLIGAALPNQKQDFKVFGELHGPLHSTRSGLSEDSKSALGSLPRGSPSKHSTSNASTFSQKEKDVKNGLLQIQRKKLDAMVQFLRQNFDKAGFVLPSNHPLV